MGKPNLGASALTGLRRACGATQEDVAARAGLSVRGLRDLESGRTYAPRKATLIALSDALGLDTARQAAFIDSWSASRRLLTFAEINLAGYDVETLLALEANVAAGLRDLAIFEEITIGADRRLQSNTNLVCSTAIEDDVQSRILTWMDQPGLLADQVLLTPLSGCHIAARTILPEQRLAAVELEFSRPIPAGESRTFAFRVDLQWSDEPVSDDEQATNALHGFRQYSDLYSLRVHFADDAVPSQCWQMNRAVHERPQFTPTTAHSNLLERTLQSFEPGIFGFEWTW